MKEGAPNTDPIVYSNVSEKDTSRENHQLRDTFFNPPIETTAKNILAHADKLKFSSIYIPESILEKAERSATIDPAEVRVVQETIALMRQAAGKNAEYYDGHYKPLIMEKLCEYLASLDMQIDTDIIRKRLGHTKVYSPDPLTSWDICRSEYDNNPPQGLVAFYSPGLDSVMINMDSVTEFALSEKTPEKDSVKKGISLMLPSLIHELIHAASYHDRWAMFPESKRSEAVSPEGHIKPEYRLSAGRRIGVSSLDARNIELKLEPLNEAVTMEIQRQIMPQIMRAELIETYEDSGAAYTQETKVLNVIKSRIPFGLIAKANFTKDGYGQFAKAFAANFGGMKLSELHKSMTKDRDKYTKTKSRGEDMVSAKNPTGDVYHRTLLRLQHSPSEIRLKGGSARKKQV